MIYIYIYIYIVQYLVYPMMVRTVISSIGLGRSSVYDKKKLKFKNAVDPSFRTLELIFSQWSRGYKTKGQSSEKWPVGVYSLTHRPSAEVGYSLYLLTHPLSWVVSRFHQGWVSRFRKSAASLLPRQPELPVLKVNSSRNSTRELPAGTLGALGTASVGLDQLTHH